VNNWLFGHYSSSSFFLLKQRFGDWTLSQSSCTSLLSWAQPTELISISGHQSQHQTEYINQTQHKTSAGVKTNINNSTYMRPNTYGHASFNGQSPYRLAVSIGPNRVGFYLRTETESSLWNLVFKKKLDDGYCPEGQLLYQWAIVTNFWMLWCGEAWMLAFTLGRCVECSTIMIKNTLVWKTFGAFKRI
jgi:hypothetical protein